MIRVSMVALTVVIPAYNEANKISRDINALRDYLSQQNFDSEVLFVDDGSSDGTREILAETLKSLPPSRVRMEVLSYGENRGKGHAIRYGMMSAHGQVVGFMDAGLCVPLRYLNDAIGVIDNGADFAIASRRLADAKVVKKAPLHRRLGSKVFWLLMRTLMGIRVTDTQCGFKFYKREAARQIFENVRTDGFMFDIEALLVASRLQLRGKEFGVEWSNDVDSRYHPIFGTLRNLGELVRIRWRLLTT